MRAYHSDMPAAIDEDAGAPAGTDARRNDRWPDLAVLELLRHAAISFEQLEPLGDLTLKWTAAQWSDENLAALGADYDA